MHILLVISYTSGRALILLVVAQCTLPKKKERKELPN